jgi:hypothetical protein
MRGGVAYVPPHESSTAIKDFPSASEGSGGVARSANESTDHVGARNVSNEQDFFRFQTLKHHAPQQYPPTPLNCPHDLNTRVQGHLPGNTSTWLAVGQSRRGDPDLCLFGY